VLVTPFLTDIKAVDFALVHTLAHATVSSFRPWINEGLAHYAQLRLVESQGGRRAVLEYLLQRRDALALAEPETENRETETSNSLINTTNEIFYRTKAMNVWWMLRDMIGDDPIMKALQAYRPDEDKEPSYMQRLLETASHHNLDWFFSDWVYRDRGLPDFRITAVYPRKNLQGGYLVTITVENLGNAAAEVPVRLQTKEGEIVTRLQVLAKEKASARVNSPLAPLGAVVNDGSVPESDLTNNTFTVDEPK
jgi:aminopeptidase N